MGTGRGTLLLFAVVVITAVSTGPTAARPSRKGPRYPLSVAGIVVGKSTDSDVRRMYGDGFFVRDEGHGGGRYFVNPKHRVTLHSEIGVDHVIESVSYGRGIRLPRTLKAAAVVAKATSARLTPDKRLWPGFRLEERAGTILRRFGKPRSDRRSGSRRIVWYEADFHSMPGVLVYEAELHFENDRLVLVKLHNGC